MVSDGADLTRYERILLARGERGDELAARHAEASQAARREVEVDDDHERAIVGVAAGVAAPALIQYVLWVLRESSRLGLRRLCFLSRDGQVLHELARRLAPRLGVDLDLTYVYSSRLTWSLAGSNPDRLSAERWLYSSFMHANASDLCQRLGIGFDDVSHRMRECGVSLDPDVRADQPDQLRAMHRFVDAPEIADAVRPRVARMRELLRAYAEQQGLADDRTGLVDSGWTGRMVGSLARVLASAGRSRPHTFMWGHEPRRTGGSDPEYIHAYLYQSSTGRGLQWRVPNAPFLVETFCMSDHGVVGSLTMDADGAVSAVLRSPDNRPAAEWGLETYRLALLSACEALDPGGSGDARPMISDVMRAFWMDPGRSEARAWGAYPYDSDPSMDAIRPLARRFSTGDACRALVHRGLPRADRAWLSGSVALSGLLVRGVHALRPRPSEDLRALGVLLPAAEPVLRG